MSISARPARTIRKGIRRGNTHSFSVRRGYVSFKSPADDFRDGIGTPFSDGLGLLPKFVADTDSSRRGALGHLGNPLTVDALAAEAPFNLGVDDRDRSFVEVVDVEVFDASFAEGLLSHHVDHHRVLLVLGGFGLNVVRELDGHSNLSLSLLLPWPDMKRLQGVYTPVNPAGVAA